MVDIPTPQAPLDARQVAKGIDANGNLVFGQVGVGELSYFGRFGALATSQTSNDIAIGEHIFVLDQDDPDNLFKIGDDVLLVARPDTGCCMWGEIIGKDTTVAPVRLTVYVDDISNLIGTFTDWEVQVVARPKFGITKDTSLTSLNPVTVTSQAMTVTAGKFFPVGGKLLMIPLVDRSIALVGRVKAYSGTSLTIEKTATNATVSQAYTSWAIALLDAPQDAIPLYQISGLLVAVNASDPGHDIDIAPGAVRDSTNSIDLVLSSGMTKRLDAAFAAGTNQGAYTQSANLSGTISSAGTDVTGTSTTFIADFGPAGVNPGTLTDYSNQYTSLYGTTFSTQSIITAGAVTARVDSLSSNTALISSIDLLATNATYKRGGWVALGGQYGIVITRRDSDGHIDIAATAFTGSGAPDLPSGYTYYRVIAHVLFSSATITEINQPLMGLAVGNAHNLSFDDSATSFAVGDTVQEAVEALDGTVNGHDSAINTLQLGSSPTATTSGPGYVELATDAEVLTGTDTARAVTPSNIANVFHLAPSTYTPTLTSVTNVAASTQRTCHWVRIGELVLVWGRCDVDPTTTGLATELGISLPVASNFNNVSNCNGTCAASTILGEAGGVQADTTNDRAALVWLVNSAANHTVYFHFTYLII